MSGFFLGGDYEYTTRNFNRSSEMVRDLGREIGLNTPVDDLLYAEIKPYNLGFIGQNMP